jgi:hypothetical protein
VDKFMNTHCLKLFRFSNITSSIHAVADLLGARAARSRWRRWLVVALLAGSAGASQAQFYQPNYITNNAGFEAVPLPAGGWINYGPGPKLANGWTYSGDAGIARDSTNKTTGIPTDDLNGYPGGNYAFLQESHGPGSFGPGSLQRTVNLPLRGNYQLQFYSPGAYTNRFITYSTTITDPQGNALLTAQTTAGFDLTRVLSFSVTNPGPCTLGFGNLTNSTGPNNVVLLDNISIAKTAVGPLANGGFDATPLSPGQYQYYAAQSQPVDSWAYAGNAGIATDSANKASFATGYPGVYAGTNYAFLQTSTGTAGSMEQSVMLPNLAGPWLMSFSYAGRQAGPAFGGNASFRASVIDTNGYTLVSTQLVTTSGQLFNNQTLRFLPYNNGLYTLRFDNVQNTSGTDNTVFIDNVQLLVPNQLSAAAPTITEEPVSVTNLVGTPETLHGSAVLLSGGTPAYQWFEGSSQSPSNAVAVSGATNADLTLPATTNGYTRSFFLRAYNGSGYYSDTLTATVRIILPPAITSQPVDQWISRGQTATFSVGVSGTGPFTYQWYIGGPGDTSHPFGTNSSFTTPTLSFDVTVWVQVRNDAGPNYTVNSRPAFVHIATTVTQQPSGVTVCPGGLATFAVGFSAPIDVTTTIQWQRRVPGGSFTNIPGATATNYTTPAVSAADDGSFFRAAVNNYGTNLFSVEAPLSVVTISAPTIVYDFSSGLPTNTAFTGPGPTTNGWLDLNDPGIGGQWGSFLTADLAPGQAVRGFIAHFTASIMPAPPAPMGDGFSFNWAPDLPSYAFIPAEQGAGSGLRVCFLTYDDGSGYAPAIDVKWGDNVVGHFNTTDAFLSNQGTNADVMVRLNTDGTFDMTYRCVSIFTRLPIPGYQPQFNSRFGLGSGTGYGQEGVWIQNVSLQLFVDATYGVPGFTSIAPQSPSGLAINGAGPPNGQYPLFTSQDLVNWQFRTNVTLGSSWSRIFPRPPNSFIA